MRKLYLSMIIMLIVVAVPMIAMSADMKVTADKVTGSVEVQAPGATAWSKLANGDVVPQGATIKTGAESSTLIKWAGGNVAKVPAFSRVKLDEVQKTEGGAEKSSLNIQEGKVFAHVKKLQTADSKFELKTPTAVAGVRGSDVFGSVGGDGSTFGVTTGIMAVSVGDQEILLEPGLAVIVDSLGNLGDIIPIPDNIKQEADASAEETKAEADKDSKSETSSEKKPDSKSEAKKEEKTESKSESKSETNEVSKSEGSDDSSTSGGDSDVAGAATDNIDSVLENNTLNDIADEAERAYKSGTVDVYIHVE